MKYTFVVLMTNSDMYISRHYDDFDDCERDIKFWLKLNESIHHIVRVEIMDEDEYGFRHEQRTYYHN